MQDVLLIPHAGRPGVGRLPRQESRRAWLPRHSNQCPVLDDANTLGYLVYPPLHDHEGFHLVYQADHSFRFTFLSGLGGAAPAPRFSLVTTPPRGGGGMMNDELVFLDEASGFDPEQCRGIRDVLLNNVNTPAGGAGVRGSVDFQTPPGWDTVYSEVLNEPEPPRVASLTVRVQTDWYAHDTEFRYLLQPGQALSFSGFTPVGQVFFVPRGQPALAAADADTIAAFRERQDRFWQEKATDQVVAGYGRRYSTHYRKASRG